MTTGRLDSVAQEVAATLDGPRPADALTLLAQARAALDDLEAQTLLALRRERVTFSQIGLAWGTSPQGAAQRHARLLARFAERAHGLCPRPDEGGGAHVGSGSREADGPSTTACEAG